MLSLFRGGGVSQVIVGGIAFSIILVFALEFRAGRNGPTASLKKECVLELKGSCVDPKDYYAAYGLVAPGVDARSARRASLHKKVLDGLVERELLANDAERLGLSVSEAQVEEELFAGRAHVSLPAEDGESLATQLNLCRPDETGRGCEPGTDVGVRELRVKRTPTDPFDYALYEREVRILANRGPKEFKETQSRELLASRLRALVRARVRVPEGEAYSLYEQERSTAVVRSVVLRRDWFAKHTIDLSDGAVDKWASANQAQVDAAWETEKPNFTAGCVPAHEILFEVPPGANDDDRAALKKKLESARERITKGESFESVAREVSEGQTATTGGELGCITAGYGIGNEELAKAALALKPNELSQQIETPRGFHLLQVGGKLEAGTIEAVGKRFVARKLYVRAAADEKVKAFGEEVLKRATAGAKLEDALDATLAEYVPAHAKKAGKDEAPSAAAESDRPKVDISSPFSSSGNPLPDVTPKEPLASRAFDLKNPGDLLPAPVETSDGAVLIQLKEKNPAKQEDFLKHKAEIINSLVNAKADEALTRYVAELRRKAGDKLKVDARFGEEAKNTRNDDE